MVAAGALMTPTSMHVPVAPYRDNSMVAAIIPQLKEKYRAAILARAKEGRTYAAQ
jgi:hypothetical protein